MRNGKVPSVEMVIRSDVSFGESSVGMVGTTCARGHRGLI
jgi:hypothetical protein